jgi:acetylglutamate kinase
LFHAEKLEIPEGDLGYVGTIHDVNTELIRLFIEHDIVPVVSPISIGTDCRAYNVNADHAAQKCAEQWKADDLVYITNVPGITIDSEVRPVIKTTDMEAVLNTGAVTGGMIPKLTSSVSAVENGVGRVHIIGWKGPDSIRDSLDSSHSWGTVIEA